MTPLVILRGWFIAALAKDPLGRYQSAIDLRHDLRETKQDVESGDALPAQRAPRRRSGSTTTRLAAVAAALMSVAAFIWLLRERQDRSTFEVPRLQNPVQVSSALGVENYLTWSPDGLRLANEASRIGYYFAPDFDIWVAQIGSGEPVNLTADHPGIDRLPSWSPDGSQIAFFSDRNAPLSVETRPEGPWEVYTVAAIGGSPRNVLSLPGFQGFNWSAPQWSSDGTKLFVSSRMASDNVVAVVSLQSLETARLVLPQHEVNVCWDLSVSPDGGRFAYVEGGSGGTEVTRLWTIPASGGKAVPLTDGRTNVWSPTWSKDGKKIFYVSNRGGSMDLWQQALTNDGQPIGEPLPLTQGLSIRSAAFSPDGKKLAYTKGRWVKNIFRVPILSDRPATWRDAEEITSEHAYIEYLDVSPDGQLLSASSDRSGNQDLWLLPAEGGEMTQLTMDTTPDWHPRCSPDGSEIVFYSYRSGNRDIWVMPSRGGPARQITSHPAQDMTPSWSPDGNQIAFNSRRTGEPAIWMVDTKGGEPRYLATPVNGSAEWSPDGQWLVFQRENRLYRVAREGGEPVLFLDEPAYTPRFSPDGKSIFYTVVTGPQENHDLWSVSLETGEVARLTQLEGRRGSLGYSFATGGHYIYFTWSEDVGDVWVMDVVEE